MGALTGHAQPLPIFSLSESSASHIVGASLCHDLHCARIKATTCVLYVALALPLGAHGPPGSLSDEGHL